MTQRKTVELIQYFVFYRTLPTNYVVQSFSLFFKYDNQNLEIRTNETAVFQNLFRVPLIFAFPPFLSSREK